MSESTKEKKENPYIVNFAFSNELRKNVMIRFGSPIKPIEVWTESEDLNPVITESLGYVPVEKLVERAIQAGEDLVLTRLKDGMYSNAEGDNEFHDSPFDDISLLGLDELQNLQRNTAENFYTKKAILASAIRQKKEQEENEAEKLSTTPAEADDTKKS